MPPSLRRIAHSDAAGGVALLAAAAVALAWANLWPLGYQRAWGHGAHRLVNDGLMTLFFLVVGLEIKRELVVGDLRHWRTAALPVVAAVGGMAAPALVHVAFNVGRPGVRGWGVPMATDVAFAMALVALLARWVPPELRLFLLSLAVADDVGAVLVIAAVYSGGISWAPVAAAVAVLALMAALWRLGRRGLALHAALAVVVWLAVDRSGVHPTIAGVALGMLAPARPTAERLEAALAPLSTFLVLPLFGLANAGVVVSSRMLQPPGAGAVAVGVAVGLVAGKIVGITGATWLAQRVGLAPPPDPCRGRVLGIAAVAGIGFTVSLFVTNLAFADPALASAARLGILAGSAVAALVGAVALLRAGRVEPAA